MTDDFSTIELELTDRCNLACPRCARTVFAEQFPNVPLTNDLDLETFIPFIEPVLDQVVEFQLKGTHGDPIFHPQLSVWLKKFKEWNKRVVIHTNAQAGLPFWQRIREFLDDRDEVIFGIDGIPENFAQYRVNAKWSNIEAAHSQLQGKCHTVWQYIVFSYNENNIEEARQLSEIMGFDDFIVIHSDRWLDNDDPLKPSSKHSRPRPDYQGGFDPVCVKQPMHFISADGYYIPCCYLADFRWRFKSGIGRNYPIVDQTILDVMASKRLQKFNKSIVDNSPIQACQFNCGGCG